VTGCKPNGRNLPNASVTPCHATDDPSDCPPPALPVFSVQERRQSPNGGWSLRDRIFLYTPGTPSARHRKASKIPACYVDGVGSREYVLSLSPPQGHIFASHGIVGGWPAFSPAMKSSHLPGRWTGALGSNGATRRFSSRCFGDLRAVIMSGLCDQDLQRRDERFRLDITHKNNVRRLAAVCSNFASARIRHFLH
jgi:hypothetical protein